MWQLCYINWPKLGVILFVSSPPWVSLLVLESRNSFLRPGSTHTHAEVSHLLMWDSCWLKTKWRIDGMQERRNSWHSSNSQPFTWENNQLGRHATLCQHYAATCKNFGNNCSSNRQSLWATDNTIWTSKAHISAVRCTKEPLLWMWTFLA